MKKTLFNITKNWYNNYGGIMNKTKIISQITKSNDKLESIRELMLSGIDLFLLDLNIINKDFCVEIIKKIEKLNNELQMNVGTILELKNNKVRVNKILGGSAYLNENDKIRIYLDHTIGDETKLSFDYPEIINEIKYDSAIKLSNGLVELQVLDKSEGFILCSVIKGGNVYEYSEVNIPNIIINRNFLTNYNKEMIKFASQYGVDYIVLNSVNDKEDVLDINDLLIDIENNHLGIITKINNKFALEEVDDIINTSEGIIISRDELGYEVPMEKIPGIEKSIINKCHLNGKVSIVSAETELDLEQNVLTKSEVSDLANAVLDGADAIIIGNSSHNKRYSIELVKEVEKVIKSAEEDIDYDSFLKSAIESENQDTTGNVACSVAEIGNRLECKAIVAPTISGYTARKMSRFKPKCPVIAISTNKETLRSLSICFGVYPIYIENLISLDDIVIQAKKIVVNNMDVTEGDKIIITGGYPFKAIKHTNFIEIEEL